VEGARRDSDDPLDREILSLRHFEELTRVEAAKVLGIEESAAAKRYVRAEKAQRHSGRFARRSGGVVTCPATIPVNVIF
jgi:hypothetical protein